MKAAVLAAKVRLRIMRLHEPWWIEMWSGITALCWAKYVFWMPRDLADTQLYGVLIRIASDFQWEMAGFVLGGMQIIAASAEIRIARWILAFLLAWFWFCLGYGVWLANHSAPGVVVYLGWGCANMTSMALLFRRHPTR